MRVPGIGGPRQVLLAAYQALEKQGFSLEAASPIIDSAPVGPSLRRYANAACVIMGEQRPQELLELLQGLERQFGRGRTQRIGQRWRARALDLDIVLWSGGCWSSPSLIIPHKEMRHRDFVLGPASAIAGDWRDPVSGLTLRQLYARLAVG